MKITIKHYIEITDTTKIPNNVKFDDECYITNEGGRVYLVEVWA